MQQKFLALYDEYYPKLYAYIFVRVKQRERAEDIVQQTFVKALDNLDSFKPKRNATFGSWLFRIAKNEMVDGFRKENRMQFEESTVMEETHVGSNLLDEILAEENDVEVQKTWQQVLNSIEKLTDAERELITLKYLSGMSYKDISAFMDKKPNTLAVMLKRALEKIRNDIGYERN